MTTRRVNSHSAKDLNVCYLISPKADIKAADQVQKYHGCTLLRSLRTTHAYSDTHIQTSKLDLVVFSSFSLNKQYKKRRITYGRLCFLSPLLQEYHQSPETWKTTHLFTVICLLVHLFVIFRLCFSLPPGNGVFGDGDAICVCLFACLLVCARIMSFGAANKTNNAGKIKNLHGLWGHCWTKARTLQVNKSYAAFQTYYSQRQRWVS